jgi:O-antigen ligase
VIWREGIYLRGLPVVAAALLFIGWTVASAGWSPSRVLAPKSVSYLLTFTVICVVGGALVVANSRERTVRFFLLALGLSSLMAFYGLYIYAAYGDFRRWAGWEDTEGRAYLAFGHTVVNGAGIAFCLAVFARLGSLRQVAGAALFGASALFLLVGGGRGPFLGVVLAALAGLATRPPVARRGRIDLPYATVAASLMLTLGAAYIAYLVVSGGMTTTLARFVKLANEADNPTMLQGANRFDYWAAAWRFWLDSPIIGHGLNSFAVLFRGGREVEGTHPHNILLQILSETGLVGLAFFATFVWLAARHCGLARLRRDPLLVCALLFVITSSMSALFGRDIVGVRKLFFAIGLLVLRPPATVATAAPSGADGETAGAVAAVSTRAAAALRRRPAGAAR